MTSVMNMSAAQLQQLRIDQGLAPNTEQGRQMLAAQKASANATATPAFTPWSDDDPRMKDLAGITGYLKKSREGDIQDGQNFASKYFGAGNPQMQAIMDARQKAAFGPDAQTAIARAAGQEDINRNLQTAMRQFAGRMPSTGVRGGAAGAMGGMLARDSVTATRGLNRDLSLQEAQRKQQALDDYEKSVTGERAGQLGTTFGYAGLGSQDRFGGMGYLQSQDFLRQAQDAVAGGGGGGGSGGAKSPWQINGPGVWNKYQEAWGHPSVDSYKKAWTPSSWGS